MKFSLNLSEFCHFYEVKFMKFDILHDKSEFFKFKFLFLNLLTQKFFEFYKFS